MKKNFIVGILSVLLSACVSPYASDGETRYKNSRNGAGLVIPPPLSGENISHFYDLPSQNKLVDVDISPSLD